MRGNLPDHTHGPGALGLLPHTSNLAMKQLRCLPCLHAGLREEDFSGDDDF